ncbi:MAG: cation:proton antiporter subunit C [Deltaproteobacteria bacterium]|nr:cation:proton antiporter subunit C [Deltaproteobacteria bacterium]
MSGATVFGLCGAALVGLGLYGVATGHGPLRKLLAFNVLGGGVFLVLAVIARRGAGAGLAADPVPQALIITGIVVAFASTALAVALVRRLAEVDAAAAPGSGDGTGTVEPPGPHRP